MLFVVYFEGFRSHRLISWWCSDRRSIGEFLGLSPTDPVPKHSCVSKTQKGLPKEVYDEVFRFILRVAARKLSVIMRALCGIGGPKALQGLRALVQLAWSHFDKLISSLESLPTAPV